MKLLKLSKSVRKMKLFLFSQKNGESFSKLLNAVNGAGPCLIVIESDKGRTFGGFANEGFSCGNQYTGDSRCFLFQDHPRLAIYSATGFNSDFAYLNHQQAFFPSGLVSVIQICFWVSHNNKISGDGWS